MPQRKNPLLLLLTSLVAAVFVLSGTTEGHNITRILAAHPQYSTFNKYLTLTHLAGEINRRLTITVLCVDNSAMSGLLSKGLSLYTIKNVLSLHILADYYGAKKLHQLTHGTTLVSSLFQASGSAEGTSGYVNITNMRGGKVGFGVQDNDKLTAHFVKSVKEDPYKIAVLEISQVLTSEEAEAPMAGPSDFNLTIILAKQGCQSFADLLKSTGTEPTFQINIEAGLTVLCPSDGAIKAFMPRFHNLTAAQKSSLVLYHGIATYNSLQMFKQNNGVFNTLASDRASKYDFDIQTDGEDITVDTDVVTAKLTGTLIDQEPLAVYKVDKVLLPHELFKPSASSPAKKGKGTVDDDADADAPDSSDSDADADAPADDSEDQVADEDANGANYSSPKSAAAVLMMFFLGFVLLV